MSEQPPGAVITVLLVDDHAVVRQGYHRLLASDRPVYLSSLLAWQVPFFAQLLDVVRARFTVRAIAPGTYAISERERTD